jgi:hypothetical protein
MDKQPTPPADAPAALGWPDRRSTLACALGVGWPLLACG